MTAIFNCRLIAETKKAMLIEDSRMRENWFAKSQIEILDLEWCIGDSIQIEIPEWLCRQIGWSEK